MLKNLESKKNRWAYFFCAISAIGALVYGYDNTYYNGVLAMRDFKNDYGDHLDKDGPKALGVTFTSLTASSIYIGDALGSLISAPINDKYGRKATFWFAAICILAGGVTQVADTRYEGVLTFGHILIGIGMGQCTVTSLLYIGEVAPLHIRGPALMMFQFLQSISQLIAAGITQGTEGVKSSLSYETPMGGLIILPLMLFAGLPFFPETPTWYVSRERHADAATALGRIHKGNENYDATQDLTILTEAHQRQKEHQDKSSWLALIRDPIKRRKSSTPLARCTPSKSAVYCSSTFTMSSLRKPLIFAVAAAVITGNKVPRRNNLLITTGMMFFAFIVIGSIGTQGTRTRSGQYVIVVFSFVIIVAFNYGLGPLAYTVAREMAIGPNQNKIMSFSIIFFYFITWLGSFTAPCMYYSAGWGPMVGSFYAGTTLTSLAWVWFCVGDTNGRSTLELSLFFEQGIPVRQWRTHVFPNLKDIVEESERRRSSVAYDPEKRRVSVVETVKTVV